MDFNKIMTEAVAAATKAGADHLQSLISKGPRYTVHNTGIGGVMTEQNRVGEMLDLCGFAWITIDGRSPLVRGLKSLGKPYASGISGNGWFMLKSYSRGFHLSFNTNNRRQEISVNEAECKAAVEVFRQYGFDCTTQTRLD